MNNTNTEAKTASMCGSVSTAANYQLHYIKQASDRLRYDLLDFGEFEIIEKVASLGALLSHLTLAVRQAQGGNIQEVEEIDTDRLIDELCELPIFIESLTKVIGAVSYLNNVIEQETAK